MVQFTYILSLLSLAALGTAAPTTTPKFNVLAARDVSCRDDLPEDTLANTSEAVACIDYLAALGSQPCPGTVSAQVFCRSGQTQITGISIVSGGGTATATCQEVAQSAGRILDLCSRGDGKVRGANEAISNAQLIVDIRCVA